VTTSWQHWKRNRHACMHHRRSLSGFLVGYQAK